MSRIEQNDPFLRTKNAAVIIDVMVEQILEQPEVLNLEEQNALEKKVRETTEATQLFIDFSPAQMSIVSLLAYNRAQAIATEIFEMRREL